MTYQALADAQGVKLDSLRRTIRRKNLSPSHRMSADADVPANILTALGYTAEDQTPESPAIPQPPTVADVERLADPRPDSRAEEKNGVRAAPERVAAIPKRERIHLNGLNGDQRPRTAEPTPPPVVAERDPVDAIEWLFGSAFVRVSAVFILVVLGGVSFCIVSVVRVLSYDRDASRSVFEVIADTPVPVLIGYAFAGAVVHFTGLLNAYVQSKKATTYNNPAEGWIFGFAIFETLLHATSFGAFGDLGSYWSGVVVMSVALPLSTAALAVVLFARK